MVEWLIPVRVETVRYEVAPFGIPWLDEAALIVVGVLCLYWAMRYAPGGVHRL